MIGYLVFSYDTAPYGELSDTPIAVFLDKVRAGQYVERVNDAAWGDKEGWESTPSFLYYVKEIEVIE